MHRKKKRGNDGVKLNLAAMLDMAFQLLAFFILTYRPAPVEGQLALHLPPPSPLTKDVTNAAVQKPATGPPVRPGVEAIVIVVRSTPGGTVQSMTMMGRPIFTGPANTRALMTLDQTLRDLMKFKDPPFEQVVIRVGKELKYEELMKVVDICTKQKLANGKPLNEVRFTELNEDGAKG